jgi:hypothetical protein
MSPSLVFFCDKGVSVMEDEGTLGDHQSGVSATDGNWHHVVRAQGKDRHSNSRL